MDISFRGRNSFDCFRRLALTFCLAIGAAWLVAGGSAFAQPASRIRVERTPIGGGAEVMTWFERLPASAAASGRDEIPILSVLNDTLSSPGEADDRLRQVWVYTYAPPSLAQRAEGAVPFLYHRLWADTGAGTKPPRAVFDMGAPSQGVWVHVAAATLQAELIYPAGALARLTTHSYGGNLGEYKTTHIWEALDALPESGSPSGLDDGEYSMLQSRLQLQGRMFSGLVSDGALPDFYEKYQTGRTEMRGHNWELLRQTAEENGLEFQPLTIGGRVNSFAMVWVARENLECGPRPRHEPARHFDAQFLKIQNPFGDGRLCRWNGYSQQWNADGRRTTEIPLALYSLDYPGVPLLLVDFRRAAGPTRAEMTLRLTDDVTVGVFNLTGFGTTRLGFEALKAGWLFVHKRHGSATNRAMRRREFVELRHALGTDGSLDPELRTQLARRLEKLDIDPLDRTWGQEVRGAWSQYEALMRSANDPQGLARIVRADREQEAGAMAHGPGARILLRAASISTFGIYRHHDAVTSSTLAEIAEARREAASKSGAGE